MMKTGKNILLYFLFFALVTLVSCTVDDEDEITDGDWWEMSDFDGVPRSDAVCFKINDMAYIGLGYDGDDRMNDFWKYDPDNNFWTKVASFPGAARNGAVAFSMDGKGYVGTGYDGEDELKDFWEYDPSKDTWTQKADFMGSARYGAVGFAVSGKGYIGSGYDGNYLKDFYAYSPESDTWEQIISIGGSKRRDAACFVIGSKAYVMSGLDNGVYEDDLWEYDPSTGYWTEKRAISDDDDDLSYDDDYLSIARINGVGFTLNGLGYLATGSIGSMISNIWEYDPQLDLWTEKTSFEGTSRTEAVGFAVGSRGYIATGRSSTYYFDDIWTFDPVIEYDEDN
ncbi:kelch repeat-containing protein [uncultured Draconibacterium sp.]|uniref:Kelch repeat-containing protein n=1 Tax=uncultured Draconibacterium sp. TaxID=1573823 RepID=UPI0029C749DF|nr:kelch repeat-containing protein [uncultured Draconibacterium sp.]